MTAHTPALTSAKEASILPNQPFFSWLRTQTALFISHIAAVFTFISFVVATTYYAVNAKKETWEAGKLDPQTVEVIIDYLHILIIPVFIVVVVRYLDQNEAGSYRVSLVLKRLFNRVLTEPRSGTPSFKPVSTYTLAPPDHQFPRRLHVGMMQMRTFKRRFLWFWCAMLALYVVFGWDNTRELLKPMETPVASAQSNHTTGTALNGAAATNVVFGIDQDDKASVAGANVPNADPRTAAKAAEAIQNAKSEGRSRVFLAVLEFGFNNLSWLMIYWCYLGMFFTQPGSKATERKHIVKSIILVAIFTALFPVLIYKRGGPTVGELKEYRAVFDALSGTINAIVLALLISRLDSKLIGLPARLIGVLYFYAAVQPLFVAFEQGSNNILHQITASVLAFVLVSKIYFFLIIMYALQTGRVLNYMVCFPTMRLRSKVRKFHDKSQYLRVYFERQTSTNRRMQQVDRLEKYLFHKLNEKHRRRIKQRAARLILRIKSQRALVLAEWCGMVSLIGFFGSLIAYLLLKRMNLVAEILAHPLALHRMNHSVLWIQLAAVLVMIGIVLLSRLDKGGHSASVPQAAQHFLNETTQTSPYSAVIAQKQLHKFKEYFLWFWIVTFGFYGVLLLESNYKSSAVAFLFPFLKFLLSAANLLLLFWCFVILQAPAYDVVSRMRQKLFINYSVLVIAVLVTGFVLLLAFPDQNDSLRDTPRDFITVFDGLVGTLGAVALALLIARLDSKLFNLRRPQMYVLFAYAAIQPLFIVFEQNEQVFKTIEAAVVFGALGLKVCFFLTIVHCLQGGRMLNYLVLYPSLSDRIHSIFENQFEIRTLPVGKRFNLSIWKKNELVYAGSSYDNRAACDEIVEKLHKRMPLFDQQKQPDPVAGTHWVEIRDEKGNLVCESIPMKSKDEVKKLVNESVRMIPYCKYTRG